MPEAKVAPKVFKFPKTLGSCIDRLSTLDDRITSIKKQADNEVKPLQEEYDALEKHLIDTIDKTDLDGASGKTATVSIEHPTYPKVNDWEVFYKYIIKTKSFDLLQRRVSMTAFRARWDDKKVVPGTEMFRDTKLKLKSK